MEKNLSRRNFLLGASLFGAGAGLSLAGCAPKAEGQPSAEQGDFSAQQEPNVWDLGEIGEPEETISAEVCIVGGGGTGMAAAIQCAELGIKPVIIEAQMSLGGSFVGTEFVTAIGSDMQKAAGVEDSVMVATEEHLGYHHYIPHRDLVANFLGRTAENVKWLESQGVKFKAAVGYKNRACMYDAQGESMCGTAFIKAFTAKVEEHGVDVRTKTRARKILLDDAGKVSGIIAERDDGSFIQVDAPAVILATGGYSNNYEFRDEVTSFEAENVQDLGMPCRQADGIKMAAAVGAGTSEGLGAVMWCGPVVIGAIDASWQTDAYVAGVQPMLWVNQDAERFIREDIFKTNFSGAGVCVRNQKRAFTVFSEENMKDWEVDGPYLSVFSFGVPGKPMTEARPVLEGLKSVHIGDTLEEVAEAAGLDPTKFVETVERYNELCAAAEGLDPASTEADADFGKAAECMRPLKNGPYWLCEVAAAYFTTVGGIKIGAEAQVLTKDGSVIPGLYAGGCDAGSLHGDSYDVTYMPGSAAGWAIASGRIAAESAAKFIGA